MLYDDAEQIEVRHVISLEYHDVSIYGGGEEEILDGELFLKRNAICLTRKQPAKGDMGITSLPFYFFSENRSDKEDFYFALLRNQQVPGSQETPPEPLQFDPKDIIRLVQALHSSQEHLQTRWINALIGRLFLAMYKTPLFEGFIRKKIVKMISRVKKPTFITRIVLQRIVLGDSGPFILNPRLRDLTVHGDCMAEADVKYAGNFRIEVAATARIDLGRRFGAREVEIVLAVVVRKVEGHMLVKFKPPPSNRIWCSFETMPMVEMTIEPIVSTRQVTYSIILRAIESRIREVIAESIVLPFWSDVSFMDTRNQKYRGGIWKQDEEPEKHEEIKNEDPEDEAEAGPEGFDISNLKQLDERTMSMPTIPASLSNIKLRGNKAAKSTVAGESASASTTGLDKSPGDHTPRVIRSKSFAPPADPTVTTNSANAENDSLSTLKKDAAAAMKEISERSSPTSPATTPFASPPNETVLSVEEERRDSVASKISSDAEAIPAKKSLASIHSNASQGSIPPDAAAPTFEKDIRASPRRTATLASLTNAEKRQQSLANISAATAAAKNWGLGMINRRNEAKANNGPRPGTPEQPIGRGRPLPPPGVPLPPPDRSTRSIPTLPKRKPVAPPLLPERNKVVNGPSNTEKPQVPPLPERRKQRGVGQAGEEVSSDEVFVVEAPTESAPTTPTETGAKELVAPSGPKIETPKQKAKVDAPPLPSRVTEDVAVDVKDGAQEEAEEPESHAASQTTNKETREAENIGNDTALWAMNEGSGNSETDPINDAVEVKDGELADVHGKAIEEPPGVEAADAS